MSELPIVELDRVWHVGSMDPARKGRNSYEGGGLSVSIHPEEWAEIARLGGETWLLERGGGSFLDVHSLDDRQRQTIRAWALDRELCESITVFRAIGEDEEGGTSWIDCESRDEAMEELGLFAVGDGYESELSGQSHSAEDVDAMIVEVGGLRATRKLLDLMCHDRPAIGELAEDLAIVAYAMAVLEVDGCWWDDRLDPARLSAPRGTIFEARLAEWAVSVVAGPKVGPS